MKTFVYIDGFNLYYSIRTTNYKWLNLKTFCDLFLGGNYSVDRIKYYTAHVSGATDPGQPFRQQTYLRALKTIPEIEIFYGSFLANPKWRPLLNLPVADRRIGPSGVVLTEGTYPVDPLVAGNPTEYLPIGKHGGGNNHPKASPVANAVMGRVYDMSEKGSDVNLAVHLLNDAWKDSFAAAAIVSNDTDLCEPIRIVAKEMGKHVVLLCTAQRGASAPLVQVATTVRHVHRDFLRDAQFPNPVIPPQAGWKPIVKPATW